MPVQNAADVTSLHASLGSVHELLEQRRAVYSAAVELFCGSIAAEVSLSVLDNPAVRAHIGSALAGEAELDPGQLASVDDLTDADATFAVSSLPVRVASSHVALDALAPAVARITGQLRRHGVDAGPRLLTDADAAFAPALAAVRRGVERAVHLSPELIADLLPHVALIAVLARADSARLGSASSRDHPGLVMMPEPQSGMEMAEALVHEGSHQKFFDLAITRSLFGPNQSEAPCFTPPWAPTGAPQWALEQCFAAFHTYVLLGVFHSATQLDKADVARELSPHSLLPMAEGRATALGDWMVEQGQFLGADGRALVGRLRGAEVPSSERSHGRQPAVPALPDADVVRHCGDRTLLMRAGAPVELYWVTRSTFA